MLKDKIAFQKPLTVPEIRALHELTQRAFAKKLNIPYSTYVKKEIGDSPWAYSEIERIHAVTGIPMYLIEA